MKNKYIIGFDTICDGHQCQEDWFSTYDEAFKEMFIDNLESIKGNGSYLGANRKDILELMNRVKGEGVEAMKALFKKYPEANYHETFVIKANDFSSGRKFIV